MELTKENSKNLKSDLAINDLSHFSKQLTISNSKLPLKDNNINNKHIIISIDAINVNIKEKKNKKRVKFKTGDFIQVIKIESYKKFNLNNNYNDRCRQCINCDCIIF